ncbi:DUF6691 family protein [Tepidimonas charontis]|uniref:Putative selenium metabolism protein, YedE family n=1 Tax=Tepidimonas charontis TaxID=2267262 RepID=A0A554XIY5_9BURK|nr:DUF6691 family protein [Tepidimonas charontis]TSE35758.1 putative selenium metabolism protein, YedE family [Tepidimonas charontis]
MFPLNETVWSALLVGFAFGYILENAGFGSPCKLTGQFTLRDWSVLKVMFTAIVVAATGLQVLGSLGMLDLEAVFVPTSLVVASALGGVLVGAGFAIGGYCPGTSVVGVASGRLDAVVFFVGLIVGTFAFAGLYGPAIEALMAMGEVESGDTVHDAWDISPWWLIAAMAAALVGVHYLGRWFEQRYGGPIGADEAVCGEGGCTPPSAAGSHGATAR